MLHHCNLKLWIGIEGVFDMKSNVVYGGHKQKNTTETKRKFVQGFKDCERDFKHDRN